MIDFNVRVSRTFESIIIIKVPKEDAHHIPKIVKLLKEIRGGGRQ